MLCLPVNSAIITCLVCIFVGQYNDTFMGNSNVKIIPGLCEHLLWKTPYSWLSDFNLSPFPKAREFKAHRPTAFVLQEKTKSLILCVYYSFRLSEIIW